MVTVETIPSLAALGSDAIQATLQDVDVVCVTDLDRDTMVSNISLEIPVSLRALLISLIFNQYLRTSRARTFCSRNERFASTMHADFKINHSMPGALMDLPDLFSPTSSIMIILPRWFSPKYTRRLVIDALNCAQGYVRSKRPRQARQENTSILPFESCASTVLLGEA